MTEPPPVVADAGPLIHLDEVRCLDLLQDYQPLLVPRAVWTEFVYHRPALMIQEAEVLDGPWPDSPHRRTLFDALGLHKGERAALALADHVRSRLLPCDDAAARLAGESAGFSVHGTVGVLVRSIRRGFRTQDQILQTLKQLPQESSLHISSALLRRIIVMVEAEKADD